MIAEAVDTSLARLHTDYIDLFQIHWPQRNVPMFGAIEFDPAQEKRRRAVDPRAGRGHGALIKAGKIRHYGLSNETAWGVCEFHRVAQRARRAGPGRRCRTATACVSRNVDNDLAETLFREKMSLLAYSPLAGGVLSGKYLGGAQPAERALHAVRRPRHALPQADRARGGRGVRALAERRGLTLVQLALGYVRSRWFVGAQIIGATTLAQLEENIAAAQFELDAETLAEIAEMQLRYPNPANRAAGVVEHALFALAAP